MRTEPREWTCAVSALTAMLVLASASSAAAQQQSAAVQPATHDARVFATLFETPPLAQQDAKGGLAGAPGERGANGRVLVMPVPGGTPPPGEVRADADRRERARLLPVLYASYGLLQALDAHSTLRAVRGGHQERNPVLAPFADQPAAMIAFKAATTAGTIYMTHRLARRHPVAAAVLMVAVSGAYAAVVAANYGKGIGVGGASAPR